MPKLRYTRAVVDEALRLYPPAFSIVRQAKSADDAAGVPVPARAVVLIVPWVLHRHRLLWRDPDRFDPDRFLPEAEPPARFSYLPFGAGPRACIGAQFALTETVLVLARLLQAFRIELADSVPVQPQARITLQPDRSPRSACCGGRECFDAEGAGETSRIRPVLHLQQPLGVAAHDLGLVLGAERQRFSHSVPGAFSTNG